MVGRRFIRVVRGVRVVRGARGVLGCGELLRWSRRRCIRVVRGVRVVSGALEGLGCGGSGGGRGARNMGTPTSWLFGDAPDGRLLGTLTFGQLFGVRFDFFRFLLSSLV